MPAPMRPRLFLAAYALALASLDPGPPRPDFGTVTCGACRQPTRKLDQRGSYNCLCGDALFVDEPAPEAP